MSLKDMIHDIEDASGELLVPKHEDPIAKELLQDLLDKAMTTNPNSRRDSSKTNQDQKQKLRTISARSFYLVCSIRTRFLTILFLLHPTLHLQHPPHQRPLQELPKQPWP